MSSVLGMASAGVVGLDLREGEAVGGSGENRSRGSASTHSPSPGDPSCLSGPSDPGVLILTLSTLRSDAGDTPGLWGVPGAGPVRTRVHTEVGGADPQEPGQGASWEGARLLGEHGRPPPARG